MLVSSTNSFIYIFFHLFHYWAHSKERILLNVHIHPLYKRASYLVNIPVFTSSVCLYLLQDAIGGKLSYKGRLSMETCTVTDLPDGKGNYDDTHDAEYLCSRSFVHVYI